MIIDGKLTAAGKGTATTSNQTISAIFNSIAVVNDGEVELKIAIEEDSTAVGSKVIYIGVGEAFEGALRGSSLHYSTASSTSAFRYILNS